MKALAWASALFLLAPVASAQPPELPPDLVTYLNGIEAEMGAQRFGATTTGALEEGEDVTFGVAVASNRDTYILIACNEYCDAISGYAENGNGQTLGYTDDESPEQLLVIPAGSGDRVSLTVSMDYCDDFDCQYAVQAFIR